MALLFLLMVCKGPVIGLIAVGLSYQRAQRPTSNVIKGQLQNKTNEIVKLIVHLVLIMGSSVVAFF